MQCIPQGTCIYSSFLWIPTVPYEQNLNKKLFNSSCPLTFLWFCFTAWHICSVPCGLCHCYSNITKVWVWTSYAIKNVLLAAIIFDILLTSVRPIIQRIIDIIKFLWRLHSYYSHLPGKYLAAQILELTRRWLLLCPVNEMCRWDDDKGGKHQISYYRIAERKQDTSLGMAIKRKSSVFRKWWCTNVPGHNKIIGPMSHSGIDVWLPFETWKSIQWTKWYDLVAFDAVARSS